MKSENERNYGVDLLRMLSMFFVVLIHTFDQGGVLSSIGDKGSVKYITAYFFYACGLCCVDCYALISGYVGIKSKGFRPSRLIVLWLQVLFYTVGITALFSVKRPDLVLAANWKHALMPITAKQYWYITAYFGLFFLMPIINLGIGSFTRRQAKVMLVVIFAAYVVLPYINLVSFFEYSENIRSLWGLGSDMIWLMVMYIIGGLLKKLEPIKNTNKIIMLILYFLCVLITTATNVRGIKIFFGNGSVTMVLAAIALLMIFSKIRFNSPAYENGGGILKKLIALMSPTALGVYLIHVHRLPWLNYFPGYAKLFAKHNTFVMICLVILSSLLIYIVCSAIDRFRYELFSLLRLKERFGIIDKFINKPDDSIKTD